MKLIAALALLGLMTEEHVNAHRIVAVNIPEDQVVLQMFEREESEAIPAVKQVAKQITKNKKDLISAKAKVATSKAQANNDGFNQVSTEYDEMYKREEKANGYNQVNMSNEYSVQEAKDLKSMLDGQALTKEIGGMKLKGELEHSKLGAGFRDKNDLRDLLTSIKGADTFINHTPKEQL